MPKKRSDLRLSIPTIFHPFTVENIWTMSSTVRFSSKRPVSVSGRSEPRHSILSIEDVLQKIHFDRLQTHAIMLDDGYHLAMVAISPLDLLHSPHFWSVLIDQTNVLSDLTSVLIGQTSALIGQTGNCLDWLQVTTFTRNNYLKSYNFGSL